MRNYVLIIFCILLYLPCMTRGKTFYVSPTGNDRNKGSLYRPWQTAANAFASVVPGDTVYFQQGIYRVTKDLGRFLPANASRTKRISFKGYPGEVVILSSMQRRNSPRNWRRVGETNIYWTPLKPGKRIQNVSHCSFNGVPLKLMTSFGNPHNCNGKPENLKGPGQWVRNVNENKLYVWAPDGKNPGLHNTDICEMARGQNTIYLKEGINYVTFENLVIEGGYYPLCIYSDYAEVKNCVIRNCYADGVKGGPLADYGLIENCDIYLFGENAVDITGGDQWIIRNNRIHDSVANRGDEKSHNKVAGIVMKGGNVGGNIERNVFWNLNCRWAVFNLSEWGSLSAVNIVVRNNLVLNCSGQAAVQFWGSKDCAFVNNVVYKCNFSLALIEMEPGHQKKYAPEDRLVVHPVIQNNIFYQNKCLTNRNLWVNDLKWKKGNVVKDLVYDYNRIDSNKTYYLHKKLYNHNQMQSMGYNLRSVTKPPLFVNTQQNDFRLQLDSPCINTGDPNDVSKVGKTDIYLQPRIKGGRIDIGVHEAQ